ncbi:hypothetical protein NQ038_00975 [Brevibacterium sp. 50QC2O2]|uniref:hypothetical protein n=1 Tax=Brevibacterium sp. 50QC2O2 TaxID=2968459 RepID=UPI00211D1021|nr:hypothetical protein [Brevibacterium sp. 50QC2O2]MCQ9387229.1 hypothetical protein [Brevibacterium sp. 50QC2O2]
MSEQNMGPAELLARVDALPFGPTGRALLDEALELVRAAGDEETEYRVRMRLVAFAEMGGDVDGVLQNFAWCVTHNESDPQRFPTVVDDCDLLWYYKWIPATLATNPAFRLADVSDALADMEQRYRREGVGLSGVYQARFSQAYRTGDLDMAEEYRQLLTMTQRDEYSHCEACERAELVDYYLERGDEARALEYYDEILAGQFSCGEEPESVMASVLVPLLHAGRDDDALFAHRAGYRMAKENDALLPVVAAHIEFCALTGNLSRALTLLERHLPQLGHDALDVGGHFGVLTHLLTALRIIAAAGHGSLTVRGSDDPRLVPVLGEHSGPYTVDRLAEVAEVTADRIATAFDRRNDNGRFHARLDLARVRVGQGRDLLFGIQVPPAAPQPAAQPQDAAGWADLVAWRLIDGDLAAADRALRAAFALDPEPADRLYLWQLACELHTIAADAGALDDESLDLSRMARSADIAHTVTMRVAAYEALGLPAEAAFERAYGHLALGGPDEDKAEEIGRILETESESTETGRGRARLLLAQARNFRARSGDRSLDDATRGQMESMAYEFYRTARLVAAAAGDADAVRTALTGAAWLVPIDADEGRTQLELLDALAQADPRGPQVYDLVYLRAVAAAEIDGDAEAAARLAGQAADVALAHRGLLPLHQVTGLRARLLFSLDRGPQVAAALHVFNASAREAGQPADSQMVVWEAESLLGAGMAEDALDLLSDLADGLEADESTLPGETALSQYWLGVAANACEYYQAAYTAWLRSLLVSQAASEQAPEHQDAQFAISFGVKSGRQLMDLALRAEEEAEARRFAAQVLELAARSADTTLLVAAKRHVGRVLGELGDEAGLELLRTALEDSQEAGLHPWYIADARDTYGRTLLRLGHTDEAVPQLLQAADGYLGTGDEENAAYAEYAAAQALIAADQLEDAANVLSGALDKVVGVPGPARTAIATVYAGVLATLGRNVEAGRIRAYIDVDEPMEEA